MCCVVCVLFVARGVVSAVRLLYVDDVCCKCQVAEAGAGFAGFAANLDLQPSDPDVLATPDVSSLVVVPWNREVGWVACDLSMGGKPLVQRYKHRCICTHGHYNIYIQCCNVTCALQPN